MLTNRTGEPFKWVKLILKCDSVHRFGAVFCESSLAKHETEEWTEPRDGLRQVKIKIKNK